MAGEQQLEAEDKTAAARHTWPGEKKRSDRTTPMPKRMGPRIAGPHQTTPVPDRIGPRRRRGDPIQYGTASRPYTVMALYSYGPI